LILNEKEQENIKMRFTKISKIAITAIALSGISSFVSPAVVNALDTGLLAGRQILLVAGSRTLGSMGANNQPAVTGNQSGVTGKNTGTGSGSGTNNPMMTNKQCWRYALRVATGSVDDRIAFARKSCGPAQ